MLLLYEPSMISDGVDIFWKIAVFIEFIKLLDCYWVTIKEIAPVDLYPIVWIPSSYWPG